MCKNLQCQNQSDEKTHEYKWQAMNKNSANIKQEESEYYEVIQAPTLMLVIQDIWRS